MVYNRLMVKNWTLGLAHFQERVFLQCMLKPWREMKRDIYRCQWFIPIVRYHWYLPYSFHFGKVKENILWSSTCSAMFAHIFFKMRKGGPTYNVQDVWNMGYTGEGVVVAVVDNGLEKNHRELEKNFVSAFLCYKWLSAGFCLLTCSLAWISFNPLFTIQDLWWSVATQQSSVLQETVSCGSASYGRKVWLLTRLACCLTWSYFHDSFLPLFFNSLVSKDSVSLLFALSIIRIQQPVLTFLRMIQTHLQVIQLSV